MLRVFELNVKNPALAQQRNSSGYRDRDRIFLPLFFEFNMGIMSYCHDFVLNRKKHIIWSTEKYPKWEGFLWQTSSDLTTYVLDEVKVLTRVCLWFLQSQQLNGEFFYHVQGLLCETLFIDCRLSEWFFLTLVVVNQAEMVLICVVCVLILSEQSS